MKLENYFEKTGIKKGFFAKKVGVCGATITNWLVGRSKPTASTMLRVKNYTQGMVNPEDFE